MLSTLPTQPTGTVSLGVDNDSGGSDFGLVSNPGWGEPMAELLAWVPSRGLNSLPRPIIVMPKRDEMDSLNSNEDSGAHKVERVSE